MLILSTPGPWLGFQWCSFHLWAFSKNCPNIQVMTLLGLLMTSLLRIWFMKIFARLKRTDKSRTRCSWSFKLTNQNMHQSPRSTVMSVLLNFHSKQSSITVLCLWKLIRPNQCHWFKIAIYFSKFVICRSWIRNKLKYIHTLWNVMTTFGPGWPRLMKLSG